ncbi:hypothetical protein DMA11_20420 [Marinilabiliaceae bacterium JC017]|nr:hypothetical protein DMA11_20420 [Marinilabiliaceae bacterium JC017]
MKKLNLIALVTLLVAFVSCSKDEVTKPKVGSIENITYEESRGDIVLSWDAVETATLYQVFIDDVASSNLPIVGTTYLACEIADGSQVKIEAYKDGDMNQAIARGEITYVAPQKPKMGVVEEVVVKEDEHMGFFVSFKMFEGAHSYRIYINDVLKEQNVASNLMHLDDVVKFDTIRVDAWDMTEEAVIATGKTVVGENDPDPVKGLAYEANDQEVTLKWEAPKGGLTHVYVYDNDMNEGGKNIAEVTKGTNEVVVSDLKNHTCTNLYVYSYNEISEKYSEYAFLMVRAKPEDQIDLYQTTWKRKDDTYSNIQFWGEDRVVYSDYTVHPPIQSKHTTYEFDYSTNEGKIIETDKIPGGTVNYDPETKVLTFRGVSYKQEW